MVCGCVDMVCGCVAYRCDGDTYQMGWGWWTRALRVQMRCVLCCVQTCWLADPLPADADECKRKRKSTYLDADALCAVLRADMLAC